MRYYRNLKNVILLIVIGLLSSLCYARPFVTPKLLDMQVEMERDSFTLGDTVLLNLHLENLNHEFSKSSEIEIAINYASNRLKLTNNTVASFYLRRNEIDNYSKILALIPIQCGYMYLTITAMDKDAMIGCKEIVAFYVYDSSYPSKLSKDNTKYRRLRNNAIDKEYRVPFNPIQEFNPLRRND